MDVSSSANEQLGSPLAGGGIDIPNNVAKRPTDHQGQSLLRFLRIVHGREAFEGSLKTKNETLLAKSPFHHESRSLTHSLSEVMVWSKPWDCLITISF